MISPFFGKLLGTSGQKIWLTWLSDKSVGEWMMIKQSDKPDQYNKRTRYRLFTHWSLSKICVGNLAVTVCCWLFSVGNKVTTTTINHRWLLVSYQWWRGGSLQMTMICRHDDNQYMGMALARLSRQDQWPTLDETRFRQMDKNTEAKFLSFDYIFVTGCTETAASDENVVKLTIFLFPCTRFQISVFSSNWKLLKAQRSVVQQSQCWLKHFVFQDSFMRLNHYQNWSLFCQGFHAWL